MTRLGRVVAAAVAASCALSLGGCAGGDDVESGPQLLYVSTRDGDYAIYRMSARGGDERRVTDAKGDPASPRGLFFQIEPAPSPDGGTIAFASKRAGSFDIYVMRADGSAPRRLTSTQADDGHPSWSPDGDRLAFGRGEVDFYVIGADGGDARRITADPAPDSQPAWSPDGRWIAFVRRTPGSGVRELWLVRPDGTGARRLTSLSAASYSPAWAPNARRIAFSSDREGGQADIYTIGVDGRELRRVTETPDDSFEPAWSPDGSTIAYSEGGSIRSVELGDDEPRDLTEGEGNDSSPAWQPEGDEEGE